MRTARSLRELDLHSRVFRYPLSYMIYSQGFDGLPLALREHVYAKTRNCPARHCRRPGRLRYSGGDQAGFRARYACAARLKTPRSCGSTGLGQFLPKWWPLSTCYARRTVFRTELLHAATGLNQPLLAGVKRVTVRANLCLEVMAKGSSRSQMYCHTRHRRR